MKFFNGLAWFLILLIRGILLWVLVPMAFLAWLAIHSWLQKASMRQALSWYDFNVVSALANGPFRFWIHKDARPRFIGISKMNQVQPHKITWIDFS